MVNNKRDFWGNVALNTNLCYSNPIVRRKIVDYFTDFAEKNSQIDCIHFYLADGTNNHCECEACQKYLPSDFYVMMLNEIDAELTRRGLDTKVAFLMYVDLLWPPETQRFNNPRRFVMVFAPITRSYSSSYSAAPFDGTLPAYQRNHLTFPKNVTENLAYLREWQKLFQGDSLAFEYHFWKDHWNDPGYYEVAKILLEDIKKLKDIGVNGMLGNQTTRIYLPTGFPMYLMGQALFDSGVDFDETAEYYFEKAFGNDGKRCLAYMAELSRLFHPPFIRDCAWPSPAAAKKLKEVAVLTETFKPVIQKNLACGIRAIARSWQYLDFHAGLVTRLAAALGANAEGDLKKGGELWRDTLDYASRGEASVQEAFDVWSFANALNSKFVSG
jgi:hypothetical protein